MDAIIDMLWRILRALFRVIKSICDFIAEHWQIFALLILALVMLNPAVLELFFAFIGAPAWMVSAAATAGAWIAGLSALQAWGLFFAVGLIIAPDAITAATGAVIDGVVDIGKDVVDGVGDIAGGIFDNVGKVLFGHGVIPLLLVGAAAYVGWKVVVAPLLSNAEEDDREIQTPGEDAGPASSGSSAAFAMAAAGVADVTARAEALVVEDAEFTVSYEDETADASTGTLSEVTEEVAYG